MLQFPDKTDRYFLIGLILILCATALLYWPGIDGPFVLDDGFNISRLGELGGVNNFDAFRQFVFSNSSGPGGRPVAMVSFLIDAQDWPADPAAFKYTNIMIHLLCGLAFCWFTFLLCQFLELSKPASAQIALVTVGLWLAHPLNISTTLYIVQRMAQLMTLFATLSLVFYLLGRRAIESNSPKAMVYLLLCLFPFGLLSVFSKENGALLLLVIVILECLFFKNGFNTKAFRIWYRTGVLVPLLIVLTYLAYSAPDILREYSTKDFSLGERLLTQTRVLSSYIGRIFFSDVQLGSLIYDNYPVSRSLFQPLTTLSSSLFLASLITGAFYFRKSQPVFSFAVFWFVTMHLLESTYIPLELYFEHRNYMAMFGPLFALTWYVRLFLISRVNSSLKYLTQLIALTVVGLSIWLSWQLITIWGDSTRLYSRMATQNPDSYRAQSIYTNHLEAQGNIPKAIEQIYINLEYHPNDVLALLTLWNFSCWYGLEQPISISDIAAKEELELQTKVVHVHLGVLLQNVRNSNCQRPELDKLFRLYERIGEFELPPGRRASYYSSYSDLYVFLQRPAAALERLERAIELRPSIEYRLKQALIASEFGQSDIALAFVELAKELDSHRPFLLPSRRASIEQAEARIAARPTIDTNR